jgi:hypothetical protein
LARIDIEEFVAWNCVEVELILVLAVGCEVLVGVENHLAGVVEDPVSIDC